MSNSAENVVRQYYAAFNAGDRPGMIACLAEDFRHDVNEGATASNASPNSWRIWTGATGNN
jgi:ketosteroid isomerase-like protein